MNARIPKTILFFLITATVFAGAANSCMAREESHTAQRPITDSYFCMHVHSHPGYEAAFTQVPFGILRTWDSGIVWPQIEPEKGKWNWDLLDNYVRLSRGKNARLILMIAMTPRWAAKTPDAPTPYGGNVSSSPPRDIKDYENFIRAIAERNEKVYGGAIRYWEIWNEPDNFQAGFNFYTGDIDEMVSLARAARQILKKANPRNMIIAPGITQIGQDWLDRFLQKSGKEYIDIIAIHFYWVFASPAISDFERTMTSLRKVMERNGIEKMPVWVTETGIDVAFFKTPEKQAMALAEMLLAPRYFGADVACSYSWNGTLYTPMADRETGKSTPIGLAYVEFQKWMNGATITDMRPGGSRTTVFTLSRYDHTARIIWRNGNGKANYRIGDGWGDSVISVDGRNSAVPPDRTIEVGNSPVLITDEGYFTRPQ